MAWRAAIVTIAFVVIASGAVTSQGPTTSPGPAVAVDQEGYWCPMHSNIRGRTGDKCALCGMALVCRAAGDYRPYGLDFEIVPRALRPQQKGRIRFYPREPH